MNRPATSQTTNQHTHTDWKLNHLAGKASLIRLIIIDDDDDDDDDYDADYN
jgi:hypothetical protein